MQDFEWSLCNFHHPVLSLSTIYLFHVIITTEQNDAYNKIYSLYLRQVKLFFSKFVCLFSTIDRTVLYLYLYRKRSALWEWLQRCTCTSMSGLHSNRQQTSDSNCALVCLLSMLSHFFFVYLYFLWETDFRQNYSMWIIHSMVVTAW